MLSEPNTGCQSQTVLKDSVLPMLVNSEPFLKQEAPGSLVFHSKERRFSDRLTWKILNLPAFVHFLDLAGPKRRHSQVIIRQQYTPGHQRMITFTDFWASIMKMSSQVTETTESNMLNEQNSAVLKLSPAYETAMEALSSLITSQNRRGKSIICGKYKKLDKMAMYVKILGLEEHLHRLKIIHVAGTKGKGSTCAFCEAILRECGLRTGLFTSPHLIDVKERFRLNGLDITEDKFLKYFWDCWNHLKENLNDDLPMPPLFQFLTILAFKIFVHEKVDVAIIEVGLGGREDSTNVIKEPVVCGITSLGMDHMEVLGDTLQEIASHKAGIFKPQVPAFTVPQLPEAMDVLLQRADELMVPLEVVPSLDCRKLNGMELSLSGAHQYVNAGLAVSLCKSWLLNTGNWEERFQHESKADNLPEPFLRGLSTARLSGRAEIVHDSLLSHSKLPDVNGGLSGELIFYFDGAHSPESMEACGRWFSSAVKDEKNSTVPLPCRGIGGVDEFMGNGCLQNRTGDPEKISKRILLFNCMDVRDPQVLLPQLLNTCATLGTHFSKAIFVPSISRYNKVTSGASVIPSDFSSKDLSWQFNLQKIWEKLIHGKGPTPSDFAERSVNGEISKSFPHKDFLYEDASHCKPAEGYYTCSAVVSSLPLTVSWLRAYAMDNPRFRIQVLVTGSLHLVGDVLKLIKR